MPEVERGKQIVAERAEYPLPLKAGVKDYIVYLVPDSNNYGHEARKFFEIFFPQHTQIQKEVNSLQGLIAALHVDITQNNVQQIRELVIVAHANIHALLFRLVDDASLGEFKYVDDYALALFQRDLRAGKFAAFHEQRKAVIARLKDDSWVTVRACNFGNSAKGLFALYAFFGGRANVYAPKLFQLFGKQAVKPGMRMPTPQAVYKHLLMQRFLPQATRTPARRDLIVNALMQPAQFADPFLLTSMHAGAPTDEGLSLVKSLNQHQKSDFLIAKFQERDLVLTEAAKVRVITADQQWLIEDTITLPDAGTLKPITFRIHYQIARQKGVSNNDIETAEYWAQAQLVDATSVAPTISFQLFLTPEVHDKLAGVQGMLGFAVQTADAEPADTANFNAVHALLQQATPTAAPAGAALVAAFDAARIPISDAATLQAQPPPTSTDPVTTWAIVDGDQRYLVKLEREFTDLGIPVHALTVFSDLDPAAKKRDQDDTVANLGSCPDTPGTELAAYFDRFSIDDLASVVDYLRAPFKPGMSIYLYHAQQALARKKGFRAWSVAHEPISADAPIDAPRYSDLRRAEWADKAGLVYDFDFNATWREIKSAMPFAATFTDDLFEEQDLATTLGISDDDLAKRTPFDDEDADSPALGVDEDRAQDAPGKERFAATTKALFHAPERDEPVSCEEFAAAIAKFKQVQDQTPADIQHILEQQKTANGGSAWDVVKDLLKTYSYLKTGLKLTEIADLPTIPYDLKSAVKEGLKRGIKYAIETEGILRGEGFLVTRLGVLEGALGVLWIAPAIEIPFKLWMHVNEVQVETDLFWETMGKLTAIRQWLRMLEDLTRRHEADFPEHPVIDVAHYISGEPYYLGRYHQELFDAYIPYNVEVVYSMEALQKGFDAGVDIMSRAGDEILRSADDALSDILRGLDLDPCKVKALVDAGFLDVTSMKALVLRKIAQSLLEKVPRVR